MHHGTHEAALDLRLIEGPGAEIVLSIDNELRRARFYWRTQALEMLDIAYFPVAWPSWVVGRVGRAA